MLESAVKCPERGDIGWMSLAPQTGREQAGRRPVICLTPSKYNRKVGLAIFCPITSKKKGYPFEVEIDTGRGISGVVLADQVKSLDWRTRQFDRIGKASQEQLEEVAAKATTLIGG